MTSAETQRAGPRGQAGVILHWYASHARDLPWRRAAAGPWAVLVSEVMLQQTPVARVLPAYEAWLARWPTPRAMAAASPGDAVRQWGRLGYPRRALRLHAAAHVISDRHGGEVPGSSDALRARPGRGPYQAGRRGRELRVRPAASGSGYQRAQGARQDGERPAMAGPQHHGGGGRAGALPASGAPTGCGALVGRGDGTRRPGLHGHPPTVRGLPGGRRLRVAAGGQPGRPRPPWQPALPGHRPAVPGSAARRAPERGRAGTPRPHRRRLARRCPARPGAGRPDQRRAGGAPTRWLLRPAWTSMITDDSLLYTRGIVRDHGSGPGPTGPGH